MAALLAGKHAREKNVRFGKVWLGKEGRNLRQRRRRKLSESVEIVESVKTSVLSLLNMMEYSQSRGNLNRCDGSFILNEQGELYFLLHKNIERTILLNYKKKLTIYRKEKKI